MNINPLDLLKNAHKIQEHMAVFQEKLGDIKITGSSGGGMVEVEMNGRLEVLSVKIEQEIIAGQDREIIQDLASAAFNNAVEKAREAINREMGSMIPGGIQNIPGMQGFQ